MIRLERTFNPQIVNAIFNCDGVFDFICDDFSDDYFDVKPLIESDDVYCYLCKEDGYTFGVVLYLPFRTQIYDAHVACLKEYRGPKFARAAKHSIVRLFTETDALSIIATCPTFNKPLLSFAVSAGMKRAGIMEKCYTKGGKVHDLAIFEKVRS